MVGERVLKEALKEGGHGEGPRPAWLATVVRTGEDTGAQGWAVAFRPRPRQPATAQSTDWAAWTGSLGPLRPVPRAGAGHPLSASAVCAP